MHGQHCVAHALRDVVLGDLTNGVAHETEVLRAELDATDPAFALAGDPRPSHIAIVPLMRHLWDVRALAVSG
ncbi:hypothetical protein GCM10028802_31780 [Terrabacter terrigena]